MENEEVKRMVDYYAKKDPEFIKRWLVDNKTKYEIDVDKWFKKVDKLNAKKEHKSANIVIDEIKPVEEE